jgi:ketosteroid isomerase-like protein
MHFSMIALRTLTLVAALFIGATTTRADPAAEVRAADLQRVQALVKGDRAALAAVLADELIYSHADGRVQTKAELLAALAAGTVTYESYDGPTPIVRVEGDCAWLAGTAELRASMRGTRVRFALRYLAVYGRRGGAWRLVAYQSTRLDSPGSAAR